MQVMCNQLVNMNVFGCLLVGVLLCFYSTSGGVIYNDTEISQPSLFNETEKQTQSSSNKTDKCYTSRQGRRFLHRAHTGLAFLTGVKIGTILANREHDIGHGSISSSHSFTMFGRPVNTAVSMSYGNYHLPQVHEIINEDEPIESPPDQTTVQQPNDVVRVTVINNPPGHVKNLKTLLTTKPPPCLQKNNLFTAHNELVRKVNQMKMKDQIRKT